MQRKHSVVIKGHSTSFSLEDEFWDALRMLAEEDKISVARLVTGIDGGRDEDTNLSSAIRLFVFRRFQEKAAVAAHNSVK